MKMDAPISSIATNGVHAWACPVQKSSSSTRLLKINESWDGLLLYRKPVKIPRHGYIFEHLLGFA